MYSVVGIVLFMGHSQLAAATEAAGRAVNASLGWRPSSSRFQRLMTRAATFVLGMAFLASGLTTLWRSLLN